jgi:hypothetical protein
MIFNLLATMIISQASVKSGIPIMSESSKGYEKKVETTLNAGVSVSKELPPEIFGEWRVANQVIDTNNPKYWGEIGLDFWIFERNGNAITVTNPTSGATSTITVNQVVGNKAKFTRLTNTKKEILEITISPDKFTGTDTQYINVSLGNGIYKTDVVKYRVVGKKINGANMQKMFQK